MNEPEPSLWLAKPELSDETAAQLLDFLHELTTAFENVYYDQLHRYYASFDDSEHPQPSTGLLRPGDVPF